MDTFCKNNKNRRKPGYWGFDNVKIESLKYKTRKEFELACRGGYKWCQVNNKIDEVCAHMPKDVRKTRPSPKQKWNRQTLKLEALKYSSRGIFEDNNLGAYSAALKLGIMDEICIHMEYKCRPKYLFDEIYYKAKTCFTRKEFQVKESGAYQAARDRGILEEVCSHMKKDSTSSDPEREILKLVKEVYSDAKKLAKRKISIIDKPFIYGFDIDIFIPSLNKGIEFDGTRFHSFDYMRKHKSKIKWSDEDIKNYHQIKDKYFNSLGISILHIKEADWSMDKEQCVLLIKNFIKG